MAKHGRRRKRRRQRKRRRVLCGSRNTATGKPCKNPLDSCHVPSHREPDRNQGARTSATAVDDLKMPHPGSKAGTSKSIPFSLDGLCEETAESLDLDYGQIELDYWNTAALRHITNICSPDGNLTRGDVIYGKDTSIPLGKVVFFGGTSLCTAWDLTSRLSEDLDFLFLPLGGAHGEIAPKVLTIETSRAFISQNRRTARPQTKPN